MCSCLDESNTVRRIQHEEVLMQSPGLMPRATVQNEDLKMFRKTTSNILVGSQFPMVTQDGILWCLHKIFGEDNSL